MLAAGLVQVLGGGIVRAGEDALGVLHGHLLHRIHQQGLGLRDGGLGRLVHGRFELFDLGAHAHHLHGLGRLAELARKLDAHLGVVVEAAGLAELLHGDLGALGEGILEAAAGILLAEVCEGQGEGAGRQREAGAEGGETDHDGILVADSGTVRFSGRGRP
ncbi:hypothetical protein D3C76_1069000 [compost metagenome]